MKDDRPNPVVGAVTGGSRALMVQLFQFYTRAPVKLFRPARIDYSLLLRHASVDSKSLKGRWKVLSKSNPVLLYHAIQNQGWRFIPDKLLPPIIANSLVGTVLYTTYLSVYNMLRDSCPRSQQVLLAGAAAGTIQAILATPIDAIVIRFDADVMKGRQTLWTYGRDLLLKIGPRAAFGGSLLNIAKESMGFAAFFSTFEFVKGPCFSNFSNWWFQGDNRLAPEERRKQSKILFPAFVLAGGCLSALALQLISYPLSKFQALHTMRLLAIDLTSRTVGWDAYWHSYSKAWNIAKVQVAKYAQGSWFWWLYGGSLRYALSSMPSTSIGLLIFEIMRIRLEL